MDNRTLASLLAATPPADLKIIELTAELTRFDGSFDLDAASARQQEVELACVQAQDYASATGPGLALMASGDFRYRRTVFRAMPSSPAIPRTERPAPFIS